MVMDLYKISNVRREYILKELHRSNLTKDPMILFSKWLREAFSNYKIPDPTAMCLATVDKKGQPFQRFVLLKYFNNKKMIFFTNLCSRKSIHLNNNNKISVCFPWNGMDRQVIITGTICLLNKELVLKYFYKRPKNYQISTWVSRQSTVIASRKILENKFLKLKKQYFYKLVPFPKFWGGYIININSIEFWQGRSHRLHDRFIYKKIKNKWNIERLSP